ncbi:MAG: hypothetical protein ABI411_20040 [Tahibacter sp.]
MILPIASLLLALALPSAATSPPSPLPKKPPVNCADAAHRAFDFWLGGWNVTDTKSGVPIASSKVETIAEQCAIRETYTQAIGPDGKPITYLGTSYSALNTADGTWRQFYVDTGGAALSYSGGFKDGAMVLTALAANVGTRMTVRAQADGSVRQSGEITQDSGATWAPGYDFTYRHPDSKK